MPAVAALHLGLTGGIGSGKSTVAGLLAQRGAWVIDADAIARACTAANGAALPLIAAQFGSHMIHAKEGLDRTAMRTLVFSDSSAKARLEAIIHPLVQQGIARQAEQAELAGAPCIVFDIPLLVESGHWRQSLHRVLVVDCLPQTQIARVVQRSGLSADAVQKIIATQATRIKRLAAADAVLFNDGIDLDHLKWLVAEIGQQLRL
jgi:dephospho-CoA kinase